MTALPGRPRLARRALATAALGAAALAACRAPARTAPVPTRQAAEAAARRAIEGERGISTDTFPARSVGVGPFAVATADTTAAPLAYGLADLLITDLARSGQLQVVDRVRTGALLSELRLTSAGAVDPATAPRVGRLLGARRLVVGALASAPGNELRIDARIADVPASQITSAVDASAPLERILDAEKAVALRLFDALGVTLTPRERAAVDERPTRNVAALLAYSRGVRAEVLGDFSGAAAQYAEAARIDPGFTLAATRAASLGTGGSSASNRGQLRRAASLAANEINRSPSESELSQPSDVSDPAFTRAQTAMLVLIVRVVP